MHATVRRKRTGRRTGRHRPRMLRARKPPTCRQSCPAT
jgi:hypothetical protein